jgi:hypothetical protein
MADEISSFQVNPDAIRALGDTAEEFMGKVGDALLGRTQRVVPKETWSLHDSLEKEVDRESDAVVSVSVGVNEEFVGTEGRVPKDYALFVEKGTSRMAAEPYLMPSLLQTIGNLGGSVGGATDD